jgi:hypothetical protein
LAEGSKDKRSQYTGEFETTVDRVETEIAKLQAQLDTLERSQTAVVDSFYENFKQNVEAAKKIQEMVSKKPDPAYLKGAYAKLFKAVIAEPCQETGTYKLIFIIGESGSRTFGTNGGQGSVMTEVVPPSGRLSNCHFGMFSVAK